MSAPVVLPLASLAAGLVASTVANRAIDALPYERSLFERRPRCPICGRGRMWLSTLMAGLPLSSSIRCSSCRAERRGTEALVGTVLMLMWVLLSLRYGWTLRGFALAVVATGLVTLATIDLHHLILPDILTLPGIVLGVLATGMRGWPVTFLDASLSAALGYFAMMGLAKAAEAYYGDEAIGQGDWKLVAMLGAVFGATKLLLIVVAANALGAAVGLALIATKGAEGRQKLPLGSFLGVCGLMASLL